MCAETVADPTVYACAAKVMLKALEGRPATRLIVVGGAPTLRSLPARLRTRASRGSARCCRGWEVPEDYVVAARGHREPLHALRISNRRWTYATPSAAIRPGERTGVSASAATSSFSTGDCRSWISYEDFAAAILDEIEWPRHIQGRFTVGD